MRYNLELAQEFASHRGSSFTEEDCAEYEISS